MIICIIVLAGTMFPFALLIAEREAQPGMNRVVEAEREEEIERCYCGS